MSLSAFRPSPFTTSVLGFIGLECPDKGVKLLFIDIMGLILPSAHSTACQVSTLKCENYVNLSIVPRFDRLNFNRQLNSSALV